MDATTPEKSDDYQALEQLLERDGWETVTSSDFGTRWNHSDGRTVAIPHAITRRSWEWPGVLARTGFTDAQVDTATGRTFP
jgi:hypothetical protein